MEVFLGDRQDFKHQVLWTHIKKAGHENSLQHQLQVLTKAMLLKDSKYNDFMEAWMSKYSGDIMVVSGYNSGQELRKYIKAQKAFHP